nr:bis(5'-adenosyl)-triphosphatase enpp4-like [Leptinotarsa decemlineata]
MLIKIIVIVLLLDSVCCISEHPILIVVSYDAFRYNFFDTKLVPNMERIKKTGTYSDYLVNVFPTKTFPNHHSIATGLYTEVHGVVGNTYYDKQSDTVMKIGYEMFHYDNSTVPIWRWNEDQGGGRYSATMMWPGADFPYQGKNITYMQGFDPNVDWFRRVDTVMSWITDPKKPANLVMFYIEEPDSHGHAFGANSVVVKDILRKLDNVTEYLKDQLEIHKLTDRVNVIHLSDHGLISVTPPHFINITQYMKNDTYYWAGASPCIQITPKKGYEDMIYDALKVGSATNGHFKVYKKENFPKHWHYKKNSRSPPILVMADVGYALDDLIIAAPKYAQRYNFTLTNTSEFGVHGYDYNVSDMHPFFMARGPKIKKEHKVAPFHTVDLYNLFTEILELPPRIIVE